MKNDSVQPDGDSQYSSSRNIHKPETAGGLPFWNSFLPGIVTGKLTSLTRKRTLFAAATASVLVVCLPVFIVAEIVSTEEGFSVYSGIFCTAAAVFAAALVLLRRGRYEAASWCVSAGLVMTAAASFFIAATDSVSLIYRGFAYMIMLGVCNLLIAVRKGQIVIYSVSIMFIWTAGFFTRFRSLYDAGPQRAVQVMAVGIIGIVFVSFMFFFIYALFVRAFSCTGKKSFPEKGSFEKMERLVSDIQEGFALGQSFAAAANRVKELLDSVRQIYAYLTSVVPEFVSGTEALDCSGEKMIERTGDGKADVREQNDPASRAAALLTQISANLSVISETADRRCASVTEIFRIFDSRTELVRELLTKAEKFSESSEKMDSFVRTVEKIASQTELLAINTSIEAARTGNSCENFAVSAQEICRLSDEAGKNAARISDMLKKNDSYVSVMIECADGFCAYVRRSADESKMAVEAMEEILRGLAKMNAGTRRIMKGICDTAERSDKSGAGIGDAVNIILARKNNLMRILGDSCEMAEKISALDGTLDSMARAAEAASTAGLKNGRLANAVPVSLKKTAPSDSVCMIF